MVRSLLVEPARELENAAKMGDMDIGAIIVYGGGGHGKALIDLLRALHIYRIAGIIDDGMSAGESIMGVPVLGGDELLAGLYAKGIRQAVNAVGGIGNSAVRIKVFQNLAEAGFSCPAVVHPAAYVENSASLAPGVQVFARAYVGSEARLGFGVIINTGAIISHDCVLENFVNISPGALLAGEVQIGAASLVGMGATINLRVSVGAGARIGNGATVKEDVPAKGIVRAGTTWP
jgi:acetyltransferase EpsM